MQDERQLADAMTAAAKELQQPVETAEVLDRLVQVVLRTVPGADFAGVSVGDRLGVHTMASTHSLVDLLDRAQYDLQEGPCLDAMRDGGSVAVDDLRATRRWPRFAPQAVKHGVPLPARGRDLPRRLRCRWAQPLCQRAARVRRGVPARR